MSKQIPVPVEVRFDLQERPYGKFQLYPLASTSQDGLEITGWTVGYNDNNEHSLYDVLMISLLPRGMMFEVCKRTFEEFEEPGNPESPTATVIMGIEIDDQRWEYRLRAVERDNETVHYEIDIEGEWMDMLDTFVGDLIGEEQFIFCERSVLPSIDFGNRDAVLEQMN